MFIKSLKTDQSTVFKTDSVVIVVKTSQLGKQRNSVSSETLSFRVQCFRYLRILAQGWQKTGVFQIWENWLRGVFHIPVYKNIGSGMAEDRSVLFCEYWLRGVFHLSEDIGSKLCFSYLLTLAQGWQKTVLFLLWNMVHQSKTYLHRQIIMKNGPQASGLID